MEKNKIKFNIADVLIILVLVCIAVVFSYFAAGKWETGKAENSDVAVRYTLSVQGADEKFLNKIAVGDEVWDVRKGGTMGTVVEVKEVVPHESITENKDKGTFVLAEVPEKYSYEFTVESPCSMSETGCSINDTKIVVGKKITLRTENLAVDGTVYGVDIIKQQEAE